MSDGEAIREDTRREAVEASEAAVLATSLLRIWAFAGCGCGALGNGVQHSQDTLVTTYYPCSIVT